MFNKYKVIFILICVSGLFWRLYHIEFGLPHSFHADEPEIAELAIKYTYELRDVITNKNYYKLIPVSFVYGAFPSYLFAVATMAYSKINNLAGWTFDKTSIYIFMRIFNAIISFSLVIISAKLYWKLFKDKTGVVLIVFLTALNWKLIVHAHYVNVDILLTVLLNLVFLLAYTYLKTDAQSSVSLVTAKSEKTTMITLVMGLLFGLATGTKITALISLPAFAFLYFKKRDLFGFLGFVLSAVLAFIASNPFALIYFDDFIYRVYSLQFVENGLVFDSADTNLAKYLLALAFLVTPFVFGMSLYGKWKALKEKHSFHIFLLLNLAIYLVFFTLGSRRVDRWLLPILPIVLIYAAFGLAQLKSIWAQLLILGSYAVLPILLLFQFQRWTPKSESYLWMQQNTSQFSTKYVVTEEGLDPMNKLPLAKVHQFEVYESKNAHLSYPPNPRIYDYVVLSSKPLDYYRNPVVQEKYPLYFQRWSEFEQTVKNPDQLELVKEFVLPKPNLVNLSDVYIYKNLN